MLAKDAVECNACSNLMCHECTKALKKKECPACRNADFQPRASMLARRMIGSLPLDCPNECGVTTTVGNMSDHLKKCPKRKLECAKCKNFEGDKDAFLEHIFTKHEAFLFENFDKSLIRDHEEEKQTAKESQ